MLLEEGGLLAEVLEQVRAVSPAHQKVYLIGGAVRDLLLMRPVMDLDFVLAQDVAALGRRVANRVEGDFYFLDAERETVRVLLQRPDQPPLKLDFAALRGDSLEADQYGRDFTINAMAFDLADMQRLLDPLGGAQDLRLGLLRACSPTAFQNDPLRILRGVRLALRFGFRIQPETQAWMTAATGCWGRVSPERVRDELFHILEGPNPAAALRVLERLGVLPALFPDLMPLRSSGEWEYRLGVIQKLERIFNALAPLDQQQPVQDWAFGLVSGRLGRYRAALEAHLQNGPSPERSLRGLLFLAALYLDPQQWEQAGERGRALRLSHPEVDRLQRIVRQARAPQSLDPQDRLAIYRYFRSAHEAGIEAGLLSLADGLTREGAGLQHSAWIAQVDQVRALFDAWWENPQSQVSPAPLLNGDELMRLLGLRPGPQVGRLLEAIREGQVVGAVSTLEQALDLARRQLNT